ncbi:MAG: aldo/keto reductase [Desulfurococcales archaeon]|nr:aldo/keto reductase [Desulfurococcales archaeon]
MSVELGPLGRIRPLGLGFWQAGGKLWRSPQGASWVSKVVEEAIAHGIQLFDTAEIYGWGRSEERLGRALKEVGAEDVIIASKIAPFRITYSLMKRGVEGINRRLGRKVDLIQLHWPPPYWVPLCRIVRGLERAVEEGLAGAYGLSNFPAKLMEKVYECSKRHEPVSDQVQYSLAYRSPENKLLPLSERKGFKIIAWSPLAKGALAGAKRPVDPAQRGDPVYKAAARDDKLQKALNIAAERLGVPRSSIALAWLIAKGAIPIPGTRRPERVREYAIALKLDLPEETLKQLDSASETYKTKWGESYRALQYLRLVPCGLQYIFIRATGGV